MLFELLLLAAASAQSPCVGPAALEQEIRTKPTAAAYGALGGFFSSRRQMDCALGAFRQAAKLAPTAVESPYNLGLALLQKGDLAAGITSLSEAARLGPASLPVLNALAWNPCHPSIPGFRAIPIKTSHFPPARTALRPFPATFL